MLVANPQMSLTAEDLAAKFGPIPAWRIRTNPAPGTATEEDLLRLYRDEGRFCELVDGILLEKDLAADASLIAGYIITLLNNFVMPRKIGFVLGEQGMMRLTNGRLRIPDVSFIRREQTPGGRFPSTPIPDLFPNLAVEVLSPGNTKREMDEKLDDYFEAGTELVWLVDPKSQTVRVLTARDSETCLTKGETLDGGGVLPGFAVPIADLFAVIDLNSGN